MFVTLVLAIVGFPLIVSAQVSTPCSMIHKTNAYRAAFGLSPLGLDKRLNYVAQLHTDDMSTRCGMQHNSCDGTFWGTRVARYYPNWIFLGENVGKWSWNEDQVIGSYQRSPEHNENILQRSAKFFGSGYRDGYWTQDFADESPKSSSNTETCPTLQWYQMTWYGRIKSSEGLCMDASAGKGYNLRANTCRSSSMTQVLAARPASTAGAFTIYSYSNDLCLDLFGGKTTPGSPVGFWTCNGGQNQQWVMMNGGIVPLINQNICVELPGTNIHSSGVNANTWTCNGGKNQKWYKSLSA